jgi:hypothetical protein
MAWGTIENSVMDCILDSLNGFLGENYMKKRMLGVVVAAIFACVVCVGSVFAETVLATAVSIGSAPAAASEVCFISV